MTDVKPTCVQCGRTSQEVPLLTLTYQANLYYICPQHLPLAIHKPEQLVGKLPGAENLASPPGHHH